MRTMHYADARSESGGESIARAAMIQHGFALPELQVALPRPLDRRRSYRVDFLWTRLDGSRVIGEFDGMQKYEDAALRGGRTPMRVLADEQHREAQLTLYGMPIMRFSSKDVANTGRFVKLLDQYGIPRDDETARVVRRLSRSRSTSAHVFAVCAPRPRSRRVYAPRPVATAASATRTPTMDSPPSRPDDTTRAVSPWAFSFSAAASGESPLRRSLHTAS